MWELGDWVLPRFLMKTFLTAGADGPRDVVGGTALNSYVVVSQWVTVDSSGGVKWLMQLLRGDHKTLESGRSLRPFIVRDLQEKQ